MPLLITGNSHADANTGGGELLSTHTEPRCHGSYLFYFGIATGIKYTA